MRIRPLAAAVFAAIVSCSSLCSQAPFAVGLRDVSLPNTSGSGSANLTARVHYPAASAGSNVPVLQRKGGWPVVVFLHGFALLGSSYGGIGDALASAGYVAVMSNTAQFDNVLQERDGRALHAALDAANRLVGGPFEGALDMTRAGLLGHSMGGGNVGNVLSNNPGYRCGFAFAPVTPRGGNAALVRTPLAMLVGTGDSTTPWQTYAQPFYQGLTDVSGHKVLYLLNGDCTHTNVAGLFLSGGTANAVFQRAMRTALGFFAAWLRDEPSGLEDVIGVAARAESRLVSLSVEIQAPGVWVAEPLRVGVSSRISVAAEPGACGVLAAMAFGSAPTPFGELRLDPSSVFVAFSGLAGAERRFDASLAIPADPALLGARLPVQAVGAAHGVSVRLGAATEFVVGG